MRIRESSTIVVAAINGAAAGGGLGLALANDSPFGLLNGVWTNNLSRAHKFARDLQSGMISINEYPITFPQTAFTGWKQSGIGIEQSQDALRFYTRVKNVNVKL